jgi:uncharacterized protein (TIGR03000 family)
MYSRYTASLSLPILAVSALVIAAAPALAWPPRSDYEPGYRDPFPPSYYGYNLDDPHPGYYGGGRYTEYYSYGRGIGIANFPDPLPGYPYSYGPWHGFRSHAAPVVIVDAPPAGLQAAVDVQSPAGAELWIEGVKTEQAGASRSFLSPPLTPGKRYTYEIRARWKEGGREVEQKQEVVIQAGSRVNVSFPIAPDRMVKGR